MIRPSPFDSLHRSLDLEYIGMDAYIPSSLVTQDGAVLVTATKTTCALEMKNKYPNARAEILPQVYGGIIESLTYEAVPFVADEEASARFIEAHRRDHRFWPRIVRRTEGAWTYFTPSFDMYEDPAEVLIEQVESFVLGYYMSGVSDGKLTPHRLIGLKDDESRSLNEKLFYSVTLEEVTHLGLKVEFDNIAAGRWESVQRWKRIATMLQDLSDE